MKDMREGGGRRGQPRTASRAAREKLVCEVSWGTGGDEVGAFGSVILSEVVERLHFEFKCLN